MGVLLAFVLAGAFGGVGAAIGSGPGKTVEHVALFAGAGAAIGGALGAAVS